jgi:hypothetical protein
LSRTQCLELVLSRIQFERGCYHRFHIYHCIKYSTECQEMNRDEPQKHPYAPPEGGTASPQKVGPPCHLWGFLPILKERGFLGRHGEEELHTFNHR